MKIEKFTRCFSNESKLNVYPMSVCIVFVIELSEYLRWVQMFFVYAIILIQNAFFPVKIVKVPKSVLNEFDQSKIIANGRFHYKRRRSFTYKLSLPTLF